MNQSQRRATALTKDQINYIKGCARLQLAIWRLCHRDPLNALSDRNDTGNYNKISFVDFENAYKNLTDKLRPEVYIKGFLK